MARVINHAHKLKRHTYKTTGNSIYFCVLPDCSFKTETQFLLGKKVLCWICSKEFMMNEYSLRLARPRCNNCVRHKNDIPDIKPPVVENITAAQDATETLKDRLTRSLAGVGVGKVEEDI